MIKIESYILYIKIHSIYQHYRTKRYIVVDFQNMHFIEYDIVTVGNCKH